MRFSGNVFPKTHLVSADGAMKWRNQHMAKFALQFSRDAEGVLYAQFDLYAAVFQEARISTPGSGAERTVNLPAAVDPPECRARGGAAVEWEWREAMFAVSFGGWRSLSRG